MGKMASMVLRYFNNVPCPTASWLPALPPMLDLVFYLKLSSLGIV